jgi:hypothetical protein
MPPPGGVASACANPATDGFPLLQAKCGMLCHNPQNRALFAANLDLYTPGAKNRLLNQPSRTCPGRTLVTDRGEISGHVFDKIGGPTPGCGDQMPPYPPALNAGEIKCLKDWLKSP